MCWIMPCDYPAHLAVLGCRWKWPGGLRRGVAELISRQHRCRAHTRLPLHHPHAPAMLLPSSHARSLPSQPLPPACRLPCRCRRRAWLRPGRGAVHWPDCGCHSPRQRALVLPSHKRAVQCHLLCGTCSWCPICGLVRSCSCRCSCPAIPAQCMGRQSKHLRAHSAAAPCTPAPPPAPPCSQIGDWGRQGNSHQLQTAHMMADVAGCMQPAFIISTGDNFYDHGLTSATDPQIQASWRDVYSAPSLQVGAVGWVVRAWPDSAGKGARCSTHCRAPAGATNLQMDPAHAGALVCHTGQPRLRQRH